ncbi:hypothetical protein PM082_010084 [Marasmius tenuissimus]|nr:hypothetical protein PM082_010084 [Marasmius tenuissimus]
MIHSRRSFFRYFNPSSTVKVRSDPDSNTPNLNFVLYGKELQYTDETSAAPLQSLQHQELPDVKPFQHVLETSRSASVVNLEPDVVWPILRTYHSTIFPGRWDATGCARSQIYGLGTLSRYAAELSFPPFALL